MERSPSRASTCLARARRERGQKRVPLPPARITGRKSIDFDIEDTSYRRNGMFAQCAYHFLAIRVPIPVQLKAGSESSFSEKQTAAAKPTFHKFERVFR